MELEEYDEKRMKSILQIDAQALLNTLRELECKLNVKAEGSIPIWASSIVPRLDILEKRLDESRNGVSGKNTIQLAENLGEETNTDEQISNERKFLDKVISEIEMRSNVTKLAMDSKISVLTFDIGRIQKLLTLRPTTSEFQKVVLEVNEAKKDASTQINKISSTLQASIKGHVLKEMEPIIERVQNLEFTTEQTVAICIKKIESCDCDLVVVRNEFEDKLETTNKKMDVLHSELSAYMDSNFQCSEKLDQLDKFIQSSFTEIREIQQSSVESFEGYRSTTSVELSKVVTRVSGMESLLEELNALSETRDEDIKNDIFSLRDELKELQLSSKIEMDNMKRDTEEISNFLNTSITRFEELESFTMKCVELGLPDIVISHQDAINTIKDRMASSDYLAQLFNSRLASAEKMLALTVQHVEQFPQFIQSQGTEICELKDNMRAVVDEVNTVKDAFVQVKNNVIDLYKMQDEIQVAKELGHVQDQRVKAVQSSLSTLLETSEEQEKLIDEVNENTEKLEKKLELMIINLKDQLMETLLSKQAEIEATVQNVSENLEIIASGVNTAPGGTARLLVGGKPGVVGVSSSRGGISAGSDRVRTPYGESHGSIGTIGGPSQDGFTLIMDQSHAEFLADLCANYEEICTKKAKMVELPDSMCEQVANAAQTICGIIAQFTDIEAIQITLKGAIDEDDLSDTIVEKRQRRIQVIMSDIQNLLGQKETGMLRKEARDHFLVLTDKALQMSMSKHDQVLVVGKSKLGRAKIPTCIACDRPLLTKIRQENNKRDAHYEDFARAEASFIADRKSNKVSTSGLVLRLPSTDNSIQNFQSKSLGDLSFGKSAQQSSYIKRGGFKMPLENGPGEHLPQMH